MNIRHFISAKRQCLWALAALVLPFAANAQREYSPNLSIGARAGVTLSSMSFTPEVHQSMIQGKTFGITARYTEERFFGLIAEVNLTQRGWKVFALTSMRRVSILVVTVPLTVCVR